MRLAFGPDDEKMVMAAIDVLVGRFAHWLQMGPDRPSADPFDVELLLGWKWAYGDGNLARWTRADVDEVLLEHLPRKLSASPAEAATIPGSLAAFVAFLDVEDLLDPSGDPADVVAQRAFAQQRAFGDAMADPANFGMGKRLLDASGIDLGDQPDQAALEEAMAAFNSLSFEERGRILGLDDAPEPELPLLPLRPVPGPDELAAHAAGVVLVRQVDALHRALPPEGAKLTKAGYLTVADGKRLVAETGTADRTEGIRSSSDLPDLFALVQVALDAGAVDNGQGRLRPLADWDDLATTERWQAVVDATLVCGPASLRLGALESMPLDLTELADEGSTHFLAMLWGADESVPVDEFVELLYTVALAHLAPSLVATLGAEYWERRSRSRVDDLMRTLGDAGLVAVDDSAVRLTDGAPAVLGPWLAAAGFDLLLPEQVMGLDAGSVVDLLVERDEPAGAVAPLWLAGRDPAAAADELLAELASRPEPARVTLGFALLEHVGPDGIEAVKRMLDGPIAPHAWLYLAGAGVVDHDEVPPELGLRAGIDLFLATAELGTPADVLEILLAQIPAEEHASFLDAVFASDHPGTGQLLELLGRHHPDKVVAKYARKLAHRWRSSSSSRAGSPPAR